MPYIWIGFRKKAINAQNGLQNQKELAWYAENFQNYWFSSHLVKKNSIPHMCNFPLSDILKAKTTDTQ